MMNLKSLGVGLLLLLFLTNSFRTVYTYFIFVAAKAEIVKTMCEKRNLTLNTCQGRCYLKKQLKALEAEDNGLAKNCKPNKKANAEEDSIFVCTSCSADLIGQYRQLTGPTGFVGRHFTLPSDLYVDVIAPPPES